MTLPLGLPPPLRLLLRNPNLRKLLFDLLHVLVHLVVLCRLRLSIKVLSLQFVPLIDDLKAFAIQVASLRARHDAPPTAALILLSLLSITFELLLLHGWVWIVGIDRDVGLVLLNLSLNVL